MTKYILQQPDGVDKMQMLFDTPIFIYRLRGQSFGNLFKQENFAHLHESQKFLSQVLGIIKATDPLFLAILSGQLAKVQPLLENSTSMENKVLKEARNLAEEIGYPDIAAYIKQYLTIKIDKALINQKSKTLNDDTSSSSSAALPPGLSAPSTAPIVSSSSTPQVNTGVSSSSMGTNVSTPSSSTQ